MSMVAAVVAAGLGVREGMAQEATPAPAAAPPSEVVAPAVVRIVADGPNRRVLVDDALFTVYRTDLHPATPVLYPILADGDAPMTRRHPLEPKGPGEATDHPHHRSLWFAHGDVNGVDFWSLEQRAEIVHDAYLPVPDGLADQVLRTRNRWQKADGTVVCTDERVLRFGATAVGRFVDYVVTIHADHGPLTFGDTKEGTMALRMAPTLRLVGEVAKGSVVNSTGVVGKDTWGKRAAWVAYTGPIAEAPYTLALLDHPTNLRYPTWWHARDYGLLAANPFGQHDFERKPAGTGDFALEDGGAVTFRYRFWFARGDVAALDPAARFAEFGAATFPTFENDER